MYHCCWALKILSLPYTVEGILSIFLSYVFEFIYGMLFSLLKETRIPFNDKHQNKSLSLVHQNGCMHKCTPVISSRNLLFCPFREIAALKLDHIRHLRITAPKKKRWFWSYFRLIWLPCRRLMLIFVNKHKRYTTFV